jgi:hypothetical protein
VETKKRPDWMKGLNVPTKEEWFQSKLDAPKLENNSEFSESIAKQFLIDTDFPDFHNIDENPIYNKERKRLQRSKTLQDMLTPDFVVGKGPVEANNPDDFYVDVNEITEGIWGNFNDNNPKFKSGNPVKKMLEATRDATPETYTSEAPYRMMINEYDPSLIQKLFLTIKSKAAKYSIKRNNSEKFGLISVLAEERHDIAMIQYTKLLISIFDDMLMPYLPSDSKEQVRKLKLEVLNPACQKGIVPIQAPFEGPWCFWAILGTGSYKGECLVLINNLVLDKLEINDPVSIWLRSLVSMTIK